MKEAHTIARPGPDLCESSQGCHTNVETWLQRCIAHMCAYMATLPRLITVLVLRRKKRAVGVVT